MWRGPREGLLRTSHNTQTQDSSKEPSPRRLSEIYQISVARLSGTGSCWPFSLISVETVSVVRCHRAQPVFDVKVVRMRHHCKMGAHTIPFPLCPSFPCETCPPFLLLRGHMITQPLPPVSAAQTGTLSSFLTPESLPSHQLGVVMGKVAYSLFKSLWKQQPQDLRGPGTCHGTDIVHLCDDALAGLLFTTGASQGV